MTSVLGVHVWDVRPLWRRWSAQVDVALALVLGIIGQASLWTGATDEGSRATTVPVYAVIAAALVLRRWRPLAMAAVVAACWVTQALLARSPTSLWALVVILVVSF